MKARYVVAFSLVLGACRQVIGIDDAEVDPSLSGNGSGDSAGEPLDHGDAGGAAGGSQAGGGAAAPSGGSGARPSGTPCELLCDTVAQTCVGAFAVYTTRQNCLDVCSQLPAGTPGDTTGNSVECRLQAATQAALEPTFYCPAAGPGGNDVCGTNCESYCGLVGAVCSVVLDNDDDTFELSECVKSCGGLKDLKTYNVSPTAELFEGDHVQCRLYHVAAAVSSDPEQHCEHALGSSPCN